MKDRIKQIISKEDPNNPLADEQIARQLGMRRDEVTLIRHELKIPDSRKRRIPVLKKEIANLLKQFPKISNRELTNKLQEKGIDVSRSTVSNIREEVQALSDESTLKAVPSQENSKNTIHKMSAFSSMIGSQGTLKTAIQQAQAAVLYPPHGLHTLFFGQTGVGKSKMAEAMYQFAVENEVMRKNAPFVVFNCADYAKNPQLLLSQLFGYIKGAFTGADQEKDGLVDRADGGILFLDEIHRLPPEGQENLFYLIDKGVYRRLGEVGFQRNAEVLIIGATTESPESSLLITLRRRIPMAIEIPSLSNWSHKERLSLIFHFFNEETNRIRKEVIVEREVISSLMSYDCPGNTGQLHSDIRVLFAKGFLKHLSQVEQDHVHVEFQDLPLHVMNSYSSQDMQTNTKVLKKDQYLFIPGQQSSISVESNERIETEPLLYDWIVKRYQNLKEERQKDELIQLIISKELNSRLHVDEAEDQVKLEARLQRLAKLVGKEIVQTVEQMLWIAEKHLVLDYDKISYVLAIHLKGLLERYRTGNGLGSDTESEINLDSIEYKVAEEMSKVIFTTWEIQIPLHEIGLIATYLRQCSTLVDSKKFIGVVVASYGQIAKSMVNVAHRLFEKKHAVSVELSWDDEIEHAIERIGLALQKADQGAGVILLTDMGTHFLEDEEWGKRFGVHTKVISFVTTSLVVEVLRKCLYTDLPIHQLSVDVGQRKHESVIFSRSLVSKPKAIICICLTGEGSARSLGCLVQESLGEKGEQLTYLYGSSMSIRNQYKEWVETYHILAVVGTVDPMLEGIPFISFNEIVDETGLVFLKRLLLTQERLDFGVEKDRPLRLQDLLSSELTFGSMEAKSKAEVIEKLSDALVKLGYVQSGFEEKVWERENLSPTLIAEIAAIPHADPSQTRKPAIAVAILKDPVEWEPGVWIQNIFMLAINEKCQPAVEELYKYITAPDCQYDYRTHELNGGLTMEKQVVIQNKTGLHARPASEFVKTASKFKSDILLKIENKQVNGKSIIGVMSLGAKQGTALTIGAMGSDETEALEALIGLIENKFGEE
ncbi:HPr family phosphocarrier protein [Ammoniphilus sp. 3BR4]|uniref:HPr family phosphocarrier protein n=1 Tax=Ammoniphilus sp. 3BR4 TaxID=3158265 RepID=UPI003466F01D